MTARRRPLTAFALALLLASVAAMPGHAQIRSSFSGESARQSAAEGQIIPLRDILRNLKDRFTGRQLDANLYSDGAGGQYYEIQWLTDAGQRIDFRVDARTGAILSQKGG
jgi:uncharacterized membrane protein YkoI